jgi:hypothetical protein
MYTANNQQHNSDRYEHRGVHQLIFPSCGLTYIGQSGVEFLHIIQCNNTFSKEKPVISSFIWTNFLYFHVEQLKEGWVCRYRTLGPHVMWNCPFHQEVTKSLLDYFYRP